MQCNGGWLTQCSSTHELENWSQVVRDPISHSVPNQNVAVGLPYKLWPARLTDEINSIPPISPIPPFIIRDLPLSAAQMSGFFTVFYNVVLQVLSAQGFTFYYVVSASETPTILRISWTLLYKHGNTLYIFLSTRVLCITSGLKGKTVQSSLVLEATSGFWSTNRRWIADQGISISKWIKWNR